MSGTQVAPVDPCENRGNHFGHLIAMYGYDDDVFIKLSGLTGRIHYAAKMWEGYALVIRALSSKARSYDMYSV